MNVTETTRTFLEFFGDRGHQVVRGRRLAGVQRCLRTTDLDEVGDDRHLTVFQMLGSWSLGDYDGPQSLRWGWELLTERLGIGRDRLHATVFGGDEQAGPDLLLQRSNLRGDRRLGAEALLGGARERTQASHLDEGF